MPKLSAVLPAYKEPFLAKTIHSILENSGLGEDIEIIAVLDGCWLVDEPVADKRVRYVHLGKNVGMREAINTGVRVARGDYLMRVDSHCLFGPDFCKTILETIEPNWIVTGKRYFLDPYKWEVMEKEPVIYEKLKIRDGMKFEGQFWRSRDKERAHIPVDETMSMQGSVWVMPHKWWDEVIQELQTDGYGPLIQDSHEMVFKTWKAGGKLMVNKNAWFAHKHVSFTRTHNQGTPENPANNEAGYRYCLDIWGDYYRTVIAPQWGVSAL